MFYMLTLLLASFLSISLYILFLIFVGASLWAMQQTESFSSVQSFSHVWLFVTPWNTAHQASQSITISWSSLKLNSIESMMPSRHLILCCPLFLLPPIPPSIRVFSNESTLCMSWPKYWSFSFSIIPSTEIPGQISYRMDWLDLLAYIPPKSMSKLYPQCHSTERWGLWEVIRSWR